MIRPRNPKHHFPMNPKCLLTPTLSSFLGRRGRRSPGQHTVPGFIARNWFGDHLANKGVFCFAGASFNNAI
jgi:hypothetical protein